MEIDDDAARDVRPTPAVCVITRQSSDAGAVSSPERNAEIDSTNCVMVAAVGRRKSGVESVSVTAGESVVDSVISEIVAEGVAVVEVGGVEVPGVDDSAGDSDDVVRVAGVLEVSVDVALDSVVVVSGVEGAVVEGAVVEGAGVEGAVMGGSDVGAGVEGVSVSSGVEVSVTSGSAVAAGSLPSVARSVGVPVSVLSEPAAPPVVVVDDSVGAADSAPVTSELVVPDSVFLESVAPESLPDSELLEELAVESDPPDAGSAYAGPARSPTSGVEMIATPRMVSSRRAASCRRACIERIVPTSA